jgi:aryl carrier-like protein
MSNRRDECFHVLKVIGRLVDDALTRIGQASPGDDPFELRARSKSTAAMARATADDCRDAADLEELHRFCVDQITAHERLVVASLDGVRAIKTLENIRRELELVNIPPRIQNLGKTGRHDG